ncbi:MAG TPA: [FeFe] hydrogenase H-cluster radical SAM maturase HydE [Gelria sp.]|jgi:biotin synthase|nr:[FeFe] hydrogenase H-cluster radical SAM maturase HydE [Gelria sp.]
MISFSTTQIVDYLKSKDPAIHHFLLEKADRYRQENRGRAVYFRGLIEYSNICSQNCFYCGLRRDNLFIKRYHLDREEIISLAMEAHNNGYQSICLQSGQVSSSKEIDLVAEVVATIKELSGKKGQGLGITLSLGELSYQQYQQLWNAGAHRYLLRIETSNPVLFQKIHPPEQSFSRRLECLQALREIGYQVGTGVMIGFPGQSYEDLAYDLQFFREKDIDMLGMGPYIPHPDVPLADEKKEYISDVFGTSIKMLALARIMMPDINMVASTALQSIHPDGLKMGLKAGANIVMPILTPEKNRQDYMLYANKKHSAFETLQQDIKAAGYEPTLWQWGDSPHYFKRKREQAKGE